MRFVRDVNSAVVKMAFVNTTVDFALSPLGMTVPDGGRYDPSLFIERQAEREKERGERESQYQVFRCQRNRFRSISVSSVCKLSHQAT